MFFFCVVYVSKLLMLWHDVSSAILESKSETEIYLFLIFVKILITDRGALRVAPFICFFYAMVKLFNKYHCLNEHNTFEYLDKFSINWQFLAKMINIDTTRWAIDIPTFQIIFHWQCKYNKNINEENFTMRIIWKFLLNGLILPFYCLKFAIKIKILFLFIVVLKQARRI